MARIYAQLLLIDNNRKITHDTDAQFLYQLQRFLLLALREQGILTAMQLRHAQEGLQKQRRERAKGKQEGT